MPPLAMACLDDSTERPSSTETGDATLSCYALDSQEPQALSTPKSVRTLCFETYQDKALSPSSSSFSETSADEYSQEEDHVSSSSSSSQALELLASNDELFTGRDASLLINDLDDSEHDEPLESENHASFLVLRSTYLLVTLVIMLADGLQGMCLWSKFFLTHLTHPFSGTHLYVLYESYGFSVASLYCLGFATGGLLSPVTGPLVDRIGRKKAAILYCALEIFINLLEQYPFLTGLIASRMIGGFTTNLLNSVFETWLDTEYRKRGFAKSKYELIMRDSVIVSNLAAIFSGYLAHILAEHYGPIGPFRGAVSCTAAALVVVCFVWTENYGTTSKASDGSSQDMVGYFKEAAMAFRNDSKMLRIGLLQGLSEGSIQIFVFLWSPTLRHFAVNAPLDSLGLNKQGEPAYGLIFGAFMFLGVLGGLLVPYLRRAVEKGLLQVTLFESEMTSVECVTAASYFLSAIMLFVPSLCPDTNSLSFGASLAALLAFELLIGVFLPLEGVIRSHYFPADARASIMGLPRIVVNAAVAIGVVSTEFVRCVGLKCRCECLSHA